MDLLGGDFAADLGGAGMGPMAGGPVGNPLGLPPSRGRKSGSNKTLFIVLGSLAGVGLLVVCGGIGVALLLPAVQAARQAALRAQAGNGTIQGRPIGSDAFEEAAPNWDTSPQFAPQLTTKVAFDRHTMQLPQSFTSHHEPAQAPMLGVKSQHFIWTGPVKGSVSPSLVEVDTIDLPSSAKLSANELLPGLPNYLSAFRKNSSMIGFHNQPGERGRIAGKEFVRTRISGTLAGSRFEGIFYVGLGGNNRILVIYCLTPDGGANPPRELLEASLLTIR